MRTSDKIKKLCNAIIQYRGVSKEALEVVRGHSEQVLVKKWTIPPTPSAAPRVRLCLSRFRGLDVEKAMKEIDAFDCVQTFHEWLKQLTKD